MVWIITVFAFLVSILASIIYKFEDNSIIKLIVRRVLLISVTGTIVGVLASSLVIVQAGHRGVLLRFGEVSGVLDEGIHLVLPIVYRVQIVEVRTLKEEAQASAASRDLQTVATTIALNFHVDPSRVGDLYKNVGMEYIARVVDPAVQESVKQITAQYTAEELIKKRHDVKALVEKEITARLNNYFIVVEPMGLSITDFQFSDAFNTAIEQKQVAQQETEKQKYILQKADLERQTAITKAEGEAKSVQIKAAALKAQGGSKALAREWIEKWNGTLPVYMGGGGSVIIDLKSLMNDNTGG